MCRNWQQLENEPPEKLLTPSGEWEGNQLWIGIIIFRRREDDGKSWASSHERPKWLGTELAFSFFRRSTLTLISYKPNFFARSSHSETLSRTIDQVLVFRQINIIIIISLHFSPLKQKTSFYNTQYRYVAGYWMKNRPSGWILKPTCNSKLMALTIAILYQNYVLQKIRIYRFR